MLKPIEAHANQAALRGMTESTLRAVELAFQQVLLTPHEEVFSGCAEIVEVFAHGSLATRVVRSDVENHLYYIQVLRPHDAKWRDHDGSTLGDPLALSDKDAALAMARELSGPALSEHDLERKWAVINDTYDFEDVCDSRLKLAEFWYDVKGTQSNAWPALMRVAELAFRHDGVPPEAWDEKTQSKTRVALTNLQLAWGEIQPVAKMEVDRSPRYLVSVKYTKTEIGLPNGRRGYGTDVNRVWMSGEELASTARKFGIDKASYPSPAYAPHIWWVSSTPRLDATHETRSQLDVHEITAGTSGVREPTAEDFQSIADVIGVAFEEPMEMPEHRAPIYGYYVKLNELGAYEADVRDESGKTVFEVRAGTSLGKGDVGIFDEIDMGAGEYLPPLESYLRTLDIIPANARLMFKPEFEAELERRTSKPLGQGLEL